MMPNRAYCLFIASHRYFIDYILFITATPVLFNMYTGSGVMKVVNIDWLKMLRNAGVKRYFTYYVFSIRVFIKC